MSELVGRLRAAGCVFAEDEARLLLEAADSPDSLEVLVRRRVGGEPLEHLLGWVEFCGLRLAVEPGVFVPRRRTEFVAREAAGLVRAGDVLVDLCCGCGAIAAAVAAAVPGVEAHAADLDPAAVRCARRNIAGPVYAGDLFAALPALLRGRVAVLTGNAPYVPTGAVATMPPEARLHEPRTALDGGPDGLSILGRLVDGARDWLAPGGAVLVEASRAQAPALAERVAAAGLVADIRTDDATEATVVVGSAG
ncbi:MAG: release factor glutamine methyltransferase [Pseudonocardiales bacterium]|nr:release factor glutamine methyltransferase [Pseudonocardiales bacterium]